MQLLKEKSAINSTKASPICHDWTQESVEKLFNEPFNDLLYHAQTLHRRFFDSNEIQISTLLSIKTGSCPEDCAYCPQSAHYETGLEKEALLSTDQVVGAALEAKNAGATRFCMGAAWRQPTDKDLDIVCDMVTAVRNVGMETCVTLGMLKPNQAARLKNAGLNFYNHNLDTSENFYSTIISTRNYKDRIETLSNVSAAGINVCSGGIVGMGETVNDRASMLRTLANLPSHPKSVPINMLVRAPGTPLENAPTLDPFDFIRTVAVARIMMPASIVRLSAGRNDMSESTQALCFLAGANSIFYGDSLLTTENPQVFADQSLFKRLGLRPMQANTNHGKD
ncbi:MAG: biotin synthase BioB [Pseudomonadota bacterium]|nr:biotin synthase BioB [Pseudomonadota bacterium]